MAAVRVGGTGRQNGAVIDSNHVVSPHGKGNAITKLLSDALKKENAGKTGVCCIKKRRLKICVPGPGSNSPGQLHRMASSIVYSMPALLSIGNIWNRRKPERMIRHTAGTLASLVQSAIYERFGLAKKCSFICKAKISEKRRKQVYII